MCLNRPLIVDQNKSFVWIHADEKEPKEDYFTPIKKRRSISLGSQGIIFF